MMIDYLEINAKAKYKKNEIKQLDHENLYDDCFQRTAKLWRDYESEEKLIKKCDFGRIFYKNEKPSYFEIFEEPRTDIMGISKKISLLFTPLSNDVNHYDKNNCIGFRYYEKNKTDKCNYFTLVKKYDKKFFILEKEKKIQDAKDDSFYEENLDCYSVIKNIVFEKYKNEIITPQEEIFPEIIGFIYSLKYLGKFKGFITVEPLILEPLNEESRIEKLPQNLEENIGYIEPLLFDNHISVALIKKSTYNNRGRVNIILDMSRYHVEENIIDNTVFPDELYLNNFPYPKHAIQKGNSCGLWFYGIIDCIYSDNKYQNIDDVCYAINHNKPDFFIDVINFLSYKLYGIKDMIDNSFIKDGNIKEDRIYESGEISNYSFRKEAVMSYYFSLANLFAYYESNANKFNGVELLFEYQYLLDNIKNYLSLVIFNNNYFKKFSPEKIYETDQKNQYEQIIQKLEFLLNKVNKNYEKEFNNALYEQIEEELNFGKFKKNENVKNAYNRLKVSVSRIDKNKITNINKLKKEFADIRHCEKKVPIKEESTIGKYLNPNNDFHFQMMFH